MIIHTTSEGISYSKELENQSAEFYGAFAKLYPKHSELFLSFVEENKKYTSQLERAYYGVITDAIEGCFALNIETEDYILETVTSDVTDYADLLRVALETEDKIIQFYTDAAEQSGGLMADVPRAMKLIAKRRNERKTKLASIVGP